MVKKMDNSQLIASQLIRKSFEESLTNSNNNQDIINNETKFNRMLHDFFEMFSASLILKTFDLSDEELEKGIVGSGNDGGCDGLFLFVNEELIMDDTPLENIKKNPTLDIYIIQSKYETSFGENVFNKWKSVVENLFSLESFQENDFSKRYNNDVIEFFDRFHNTFLNLITKSPKVNFKFFYVSIGNEVHINVHQQADEMIGKLKTLYPSPNTTVSVDYIDAKRILTLYDAPSKTDFVLQISETPIIVEEEKEYIVLANLSQYFDFITNENKKLIKHIFEANVRDYQGNTTVNKEIAETLSQKSSGEDFWWLNNGVTMLASRIDQKSTKVFEIKNPEIVNGLQTSTEIYNYFVSKENDNKKIEERKVLIRIIVPNNEASRDKIILATNSQTTIPKAILRGTDSIHREIESYLKTKDLFYDRRKNFYKNEGKPKDKIVSIPFLAQCLISIVLKKPNYARARPSTLLSDEDTYDHLYLKNKILDSYYNAALIGKKVKNAISSLGIYSVSEQSDISFYVMYVCSAKIAGSVEISSEQLSKIQIEKFTEDNIKRCAEYVYEKYQTLGGNNTVAKGTNLIDAILQDNFIEIPF
ncbi:abortive phage resistance protein (plasmid) [Niallia circulans]|uniref:Abortive phage resistance protein n=1 Tax=Niallia circulans TaxID=1397 RepID=A0A553SQQ4_NIACI|nr:AIPR family protein [Niallia circulans]TRZ39323.1 abortive phage resistance protein [Niallia circulans]